MPGGPAATFDGARPVRSGEVTQTPKCHAFGPPCPPLARCPLLPRHNEGDSCRQRLERRARSRRRAPVMVYVHGAASRETAASILSSRDQPGRHEGHVVSLNYRLAQSAPRAPRR